MKCFSPKIVMQGEDFYSDIPLSRVFTLARTASPPSNKHTPIEKHIADIHTSAAFKCIALFVFFPFFFFSKDWTKSFIMEHKQKKIAVHFDAKTNQIFNLNLLPFTSLIHFCKNQFTVCAVLFKQNSFIHLTIRKCKLKSITSKRSHSLNNFNNSKRNS